MSQSSAVDALRRAHTREAVRLRISVPPRRTYLADGVLGGIDGCVTTFAVVAGALGGALSTNVIVMLGFANLLADGFSMAASNYLSVKSEREHVERIRREEEEHIDRVPEGEREEIRQIFSNKGFHGDLLDRIVEVICQDRTLWVDTMLSEEHGLQLAGRHPLRAGISTFVAFMLVGLMPLLPFVATTMTVDTGFTLSAYATAVAFFGVGALKGWVLRRSILWTGIETLAIGSTAAVLAYAAGYFLRRMYIT